MVRIPSPLSVRSRESPIDLDHSAFVSVRAMIWYTDQGRFMCDLNAFTLSLSPSTRAHPLNTNGSFAAITATMSTPFALSWSYLLR